MKSLRLSVALSCLIPALLSGVELDFQGGPAVVAGTVTERGFTAVTASELISGVTVGGVTVRGGNLFSSGLERDRGRVADQGAFTYGDLLDDFVQFANTTSATTTGKLVISGLNPAKSYTLRLWCHDALYDYGQTFVFDETGGTAQDGTIVNAAGPYPQNQAFSFQVQVTGRQTLTYLLSCPSAPTSTCKLNGLVIVENGSVHEAETAGFSPGVVAASATAGFSGTGYLDFPAQLQGDHAEWTIPVENAGNFHVQLGYANGGGASRPLQLVIDGASVGTPVACAPTGAWTTWSQTAAVAVPLAAGNRTVRFQTTGTSQGPNVDYLRITPVQPARLALARADAISVGLGSSVSFDPVANDPLPLGSAHQSLSISSPPSQGTVAVDPASGTLTYQHTGSGPGTDGFGYVATDITGFTAAARVEVTISQVPRVNNSTLTLPAAPPAGSLRVVDALPGVIFPGAVAMTPVPGSPQAMIVASIHGNVWMVPDTTAAVPAKYELFNVATLSNFTRGRSIYGIVCDPGFATNGRIIVNYQGDLGGLPPVEEIPHLEQSVTSEKATPWREVECTLRVARFTVSAANRAILLNPASSAATLAATKAAVLATEFRYLNLAEEHAYHSINDCKFGPDGYLYLSFGDEGAQSEPYRNAQHITKDQYSAILRIDLDRRPENLEPNPHYAIVTDGGVARFKIPADNPYTGPNPVYNGQAIAAGELAKVRTEIWATGLRNPFKFDIDAPTGELWVGDVGHTRWEEVTVLGKGDNAGWSYWEANERRTEITHALPPAVHKVPEHAYFHSAGNNSVTGGLLYRGSAYSGLLGKYVFGDHGSGRIWSLARAVGVTPAAVVELPVGGVPGVVDFEVDPHTGQILILQHGAGQKLMRLVEGAASGGFPQLLSQTGAFADLATLAPNPGVMPYQPNLTFWSDHALKSRFFAIKNGTDRIGYSRDGQWTFPEGMVFIKHFDIDLDRDSPGSKRKRLETRFLVRNAGGSYGVSYQWNEAGTDAELAAIGGVDFNLEITENGTQRLQRWHIPSRGECLACHTPQAGHVLGFDTRQLNRFGALGGVQDNFLSLLSQSGYLHGFGDDPAALPRHHRPDEADADLESRVRSYLAVNCSYCHQPGTSAPASWDGRAGTPLAQSHILYGEPVSESYHAPGHVTAMPGQPEASVILSRMKARDLIGDGRHHGYSQMPPLGTHVVDAAGIALIEDWLLHHANAAPSFTVETPDRLTRSDADSPGTAIGTLASLDPDIRGPVSDQDHVRYAITGGNEAGLFVLDPVTGVLRVNGLLDYRRRASHTLTVAATDGFAANPGTTHHSLRVDLTDAGGKDLDGNGLPDLWETGYALSGATAGGDDDRDGRMNFFEYLAGSDPTGSGSGQPDLEIVPPSAGSGFVVEWRVRNGLLLGSDYFLQGAEDLGSWSDLRAPAGYAILSTVPDGTGFSKLRVRVNGTAGRAFVRLSDEPARAPIFNGVDFTGWQIRQGTLGMYRVVPAAAGEPAFLEGTADGALGMLATTAVYSNFDLTYEFQVEGPLNSGVQFRSYMASGAVRGLQVEIDPTARSWSGGLYEQGGRGWVHDLFSNAPAQAAFVPGGWNHIRVRAEGARVRTWINGVPAADYTETATGIPTTGFFALQVHQGGSGIIGKRVRFRRLEIAVLE